MCDPIIFTALAGAGAGAGGAALATTGTTALAIGAGLGALSGAQAGAQYKAAAFNERLAIQDQQVLEAEAQNKKTEGSIEAGKRIEESQQQVAQIADVAGASGIDAGSGTALQLQEQTGKVGALEALMTLSNSAQAAYGLKREGEVGVLKARQAKRQAGLGIGTSILGSVGQSYLALK